MPGKSCGQRRRRLQFMGSQSIWAQLSACTYTYTKIPYTLIDRSPWLSIYNEGWSGFPECSEEIHNSSSISGPRQSAHPLVPLLWHPQHPIPKFLLPEDSVWLSKKLTVLLKFMENKMAIHSNILAWKSPWTEEPGGLQSMGLHDWACAHMRRVEGDGLVAINWQN